MLSLRVFLSASAPKRSTGVRLSFYRHKHSASFQHCGHLPSASPHSVDPVDDDRGSTTFRSPFHSHNGLPRLYVIGRGFKNPDDIRWFSTSGNNIRDYAKEKVNDAKDRFKEKADDFRERATSKAMEYQGRAQEKANEYREKAREKAIEYREKAEEGSRHAIEDAKVGTAVARPKTKTTNEMMKQYGPVFVGTWLGVYVATLGSLFVGVNSGLIDPVHLFSYFMDDIQEGTSTAELAAQALEHYSLTKPYAKLILNHPGYSNFAVAWVATKFTEPVRLPLTLAIVPSLAKRLGFGATDTKSNDRMDNEEKSKNV